MNLASKALAAAVGLALTAPASAAQERDSFRCSVEPAPGTPILSPSKAALAGTGGGMAGDGWDGPGLNAATLYWHVEGTTADMGAEQRAALLDALAAWSHAAQITFEEVPVPDANASIDFLFAEGSHELEEPHELADLDCWFDGQGGVLAHAGFPPGINQLCGGASAENFSGNVHFDDDEFWEQDGGIVFGIYSLTLLACHEIGHALGLTHSGGLDVMRPNFSSTDTFTGLTLADVDNLGAGYAPGVGAVLTLEELGIWVDAGWSGAHLGNAANPLDRVEDAIAGVPPFTSDVTVHIAAGTYVEGPQELTAVCELVSVGGAAVLR